MDKTSINSVYRTLGKKIGEPKTELNYRNPYTFLVSVVLSAQATDKSVNNATRDLFKTVKTPKDMVALGERKLKNYSHTDHRQSYCFTLLFINEITNFSLFLTENADFCQDFDRQDHHP